MPPTKKIHLDKSAWAWSDNVDPTNVTEENIKTSYRLNIPQCKIGGCRRNCRGSPLCLSGLGESKWLVEQKEVSDDDDTDLELRQPNSFIGLKNLGATCYVNSLLQLWFHNLAFREAILLWNPKEDSMEMCAMNLENGDSDFFEPKSAVAHLQLTFALMQFSKQKSIDPLGFINALNLEPSMQQDAQEFSKLFITLLEETLSHQSNPLVRNVVINNFRGEYSYITRCIKCLKESFCPSYFFELELNVKGNKTLHESINEFLKEEYLEGANMYSCRECEEKQEASRFIRLHKLPPVLNLQLMRFIYDRQKGHKKKLNTSIQFPESLDMSTYMQQPENEKQPLLYNLTAVLIHKGPSAYSGHYIAHICDQATGTWYKFNDEVVEKMEGKRLKLGSSEDDESGAKKVKQPRLAKGYLASSNAYMLVYTLNSRQDQNRFITEELLQPHLQYQIKRCNDSFEQIILETKQRRKIEKNDSKALKTEIASILSTLPVTDINENDTWEAISLSWISHWLSHASSEVMPIDNSKIVCVHEKLDPNKVASAKYISTVAAQTLYDKYSGGPRLIGSNALCKDCVIAKCREIRLRLKLGEDAKYIANTLKQKEDLDACGFWVGKNSIKGWRKKAMQLLFVTEKEDCSDKMETDMEDAMSPSTSDAEQCTSNGDVKPSESLRSVKLFSDNLLEPPKQSCSTPSLDIECYQDIEITVPLKALKLSNKNNCMALIESLECFISTLKSKWKDEIFTESIPLKMLQDFYFLHEEWKILGEQLYEIYEKNLKISRKESPDADLPPVIEPQVTESPVIELPTTDKNDVENCNSMETLNSENKGSVKRKREQIDSKSGESGDEGKNMKLDEPEDFEEDFNEDIICIHDKLSPEENNRRLVSEAVWAKFKSYFPTAREFPKDSEVCPECHALASEGKQTMFAYKQEALCQRDLLQNLLFVRNRPKLVDGTFHVVSCSEFLRPWRKFVREAGRMEPLHSLRNKTLLCLHDLLIVDPWIESDAANLAAVTDEEWKTLCDLYVVDQDVAITYGPKGEILDTFPKICQECMDARLENEQKALLQYKKAKIYIRQIATKTSLPDDSSDQRSSSPESKMKVPRQNGTGDTTETIRRSTRHRKVRGEKEVFISSSETLKDLKLKILNSMGVAPYDQHLSTESGQDLTDLSATLSSLNILPNTVLLLRVDEPPEDTSTHVEDYIRTSEPEEGFKGTVLLKR